MVESRNQELHDWLEAESAGDADRADAAFASVFARHVPPLAPPVSTWDTQAARRALIGRNPFWVAAAALLLLSAGGLAAAAFWSAWVFDLIGAAGSLGPRVLAVGSATARQAVEVFWHAWLPAVAVGRAVAVAAATGPAAAAIAANLTIAFAAALALSRLLTPREE